MGNDSCASCSFDYEGDQHLFLQGGYSPSKRRGAVGQGVHLPLREILITADMPSLARLTTFAGLGMTREEGSVIAG
jgi:hypothetical protein